VEFFAQNGNFGLRELHLFPQGLLPTMDGDGRLILASRDSLAMHPDGHGGVLQALGRTSGLLDRLRRLGVRHLSYFQVDNPLLLPVDPLFIGFHLQERAQISSRCVRKAYAGERVGVFVEMDGRLRVVEYMDLPAECASATDITNQLRFCWANIAAHIFDLEFLIPHCTGERSPLPLHLSTKKTPFLNASGHLVRPTEANGIKLERFIFDLLPHAERTLLLEGKREEVFSPAKNLIGLDSVETCRRDQMRQFADWLSKGKADILRDAEGIPPFPLEISPLFADSCREFLRKWGSLDPKPATCANFYLE
jgi:UDP-N-acetylglucosamine/UDP-N-acetylgalactosamine diphosphorylase